jgi:dTDP-4-amino-4,6-dideoxygalactose transaminase
MLRVHGIEKRYYHDLHGFNSRLDEIQAAILRVKLPHLNKWNARRAEIAGRYSKAFAKLPLQLPITATGNTHIFHVYAVLSEKRDELQKFLTDRGVPTLIYYPLPLHLQKLYSNLGFKAGDFPVAEDISKKILPLPMYPELTDEQVDYVCKTILEFY